MVGGNDSSVPRSLPPAREQAPDQQLWHLWRQGRRPDLRAFLAARTDLQAGQVAAVIAIDQYERWLVGERVPAEEYLSLVPAGGDADQASCDIIYGEFLLREQLGEHPSPEEYCQRFPEQAPLLRRQVELHLALASESTGGEAESSAGPQTHLPRLPRRGASVAVPPIPGYDLLEQIGRGGMGVVYKARQKSLNRIVALKVLDVQPGRDGVALDRMRREAQVMARLSHPHIVTVHDAGQAGDHFYFAMEYVQGVNLHQLVEQSGPLPVPLACTYLRQAALGLQHAHEQGLVHRDIKPSNLIVSTPAELPGSKLKLLDLGLARLVDATVVEPAGGPITQVGAFMGTPDFVAPEQANDPRDADIRSDLYSLGCTFYYALTGHVPFGASTPLGKLMSHHLMDAPSAEGLRPELPPALAAILRKLMAKRREERFATPADLVAALDRMEPSSAAPAPASPAAAEPRKQPGRAGLVRRLNGHTDWVKCVAFSPTGGLIASGGVDRSVRLWRAGDEMWRGVGHGSAVLCLAFSADGKLLVTGGQDNVLCLWDVGARAERWRAAGHADNVNAVAFRAPVGAGPTQILSASHDGTLRLWDAGSGRQLREWQAHDGPIWGVAATADGRRALSGGHDRMVRLWDLDTATALLTLPEQTLSVTCVALSADGSLAASGGMDGVVRLWELPAGREVRTFAAHTGRVTGVAFRGDGLRLASASRDRTVRIWETRSGQELYAFTGHTHWVMAVAWSPDGGGVVSGSADRSVCVWEVPVG
jgi:serine/threonine protein kinase